MTIERERGTLYDATIDEWYHPDSQEIEVMDHLVACLERIIYAYRYYPQDKVLETLARESYEISNSPVFKIDREYDRMSEDDKAMMTERYKQYVKMPVERLANQAA